MSGTDIGVDVFPPCFQRRRNRLGHCQVARFGKFDQHGQVCPIKDLSARRRAGPQRKVRGRSAEHVGDNDNAVALIDLISRRTDLGLLFGTVVILLDRDCTYARLFADDMFDRGEILPCQSTMRDDHDADQALNPIKRPNPPDQQPGVQAPDAL